MATKASKFIDARVLPHLGDPEAEAWPKPELYGYLNEALEQIARIHPEDFATSKSHTLAAGTRQTLAAGDVALLAVESNAAGRAVHAVDPNTLDYSAPAWRAATAGATRQYFQDPRDRRAFHVDPPAAANTALTIRVASVPTDVGGDTELPVEDEYFPALANYVLYRAFAKDSEYADNGRAGMYLTAFMKDMGVTDGGDS